MRGGGGRGALVPMNSSSQALRLAKTGKDRLHQKTVKVVGNSPVQSNLCALQLALSAVVGEQSHKDNVHRTNATKVQVQCRFYVNRDKRTIRDGEPHDGHLHFHSAPEL